MVTLTVTFLLLIDNLVLKREIKSHKLIGKNEKKRHIYKFQNLHILPYTGICIPNSFERESPQLLSMNKSDYHHCYIFDLAYNVHQLT